MRALGHGRWPGVTPGWSCSPGDVCLAVPCTEGRAHRLWVGTGWAVLGGEGGEGEAVGQQGHKGRGQACALGELQ